MARTLLSEYGPDVPKHQAPGIGKNGPANDRDVMGYQAPVGPQHIMNEGVGLRGGRILRHGLQGVNPTCDEAQGDGATGAPYAGRNHGNGGSQHG